MKGRLWSWMELVLALPMKDNQFGKPHTWDHNKSGFLISLSMLCQILFVFRESMDGLSEFFLHPFRIIDMSSIDDASKNLIYECVFSEVESLLIQLTLVTPVGSVIANSILELLNIDSWYCRRGGKCSEEVGMLHVDPTP
ncbi:hypothetical protein Tco_0443069 [Tanacetum coccineum]